MATQRRLRDELNIEAMLEFVYKFSYQAEFGDSGSENELCHEYFGRIGDRVNPNEKEIAGVRFVGPQDLAGEFATAAASFTPWFKLEWQTLLEEHRDQLATYCSVQPT